MKTIMIDDQELSAELDGMHVSDWEVRSKGRGQKRLYVRFAPDVKPVKLVIKRKGNK